MIKRDPLQTFLNDSASEILFGLIDKNDIIEPTLSGVLTLFDDLMMSNAPDLYPEEWTLLVKAIHEKSIASRLRESVSEVRRLLVLTLEDLEESGLIDPFKLSKKIGNLPDLALCSVAYIAQRNLVAKNKGNKFGFPEIPFNG